MKFCERMGIRDEAGPAVPALCAWVCSSDVMLTLISTGTVTLMTSPPPFSKMVAVAQKS